MIWGGAFFQGDLGPLNPSNVNATMQALDDWHSMWPTQSRAAFHEFLGKFPPGYKKQLVGWRFSNAMRLSERVPMADSSQKRTYIFCPVVVPNVANVL